MNKEVLFEPEKIALSIYKGEDDFSMSHGSFRYRRKATRTIKLKVLKVERAEHSTVVTYGDNGRSVASIRWENISDSITKAVMSWNPKFHGGLYNRFDITFPSTKEERFFGLGENYLKCNLKGEKVRVWVAEHQNTVRIAKKMLRWKSTSWAVGRQPDKVQKFSSYESYYSQPTFQSDRKYFFHLLTTKYCEFDFEDEDSFTISLEETPTFYIGSAGSFEELSKLEYKFLRELSKRDLTSVWPMSIKSLKEGVSDEVPEWVNDGIILAIQGGTEEVQKRIDEVKAAGGKVAGVWSQDWCGCRKTGFGYQVMWNWKWDSKLYPGLHKKIEEWQSEGIRFLGYINPFIALEGELFKEARENGYLVLNKKSEPYLVKITTFPAAMVDFTNPYAYEWYKDIIKENMIDLGLGGWMADFGEYLPTDCVLYSGDNPEDIHNIWPAIWAGLNYEAIRECGKEKEIFFFTRAGSTGTIAKSPMMWTGDQHVDWSVDDGIPAVIPATFSLAASGYPVAHSDAGGYTTIMEMTRSKELLKRWIDMNTFSPLLRTHEGNQPARDVQFYSDEDLVKFTARASQIHFIWKDYINDQILEAKRDGVPVMRPLFYYYDEQESFNCQSEYLLGRDVLVAPILKEGAGYRYVYFPNDEWVDIWTGKEFKGGYKKISAPVGITPVFVRKCAKDLDKVVQATRDYEMSLMK